jgi:hypothetical protein
MFVNLGRSASTFVDIGRSTGKWHGLYGHDVISIKRKIIDNRVGNQDASNSTPLSAEGVVYYLMDLSIALPGPFPF